MNRTNKHLSKVFKYVFLIIFFVVFFGISIIFWGMIAKHFENKNIVKNGVVINAEVVGYETNTSINDVNYYYVKYTFEYESVTYNGTSSTNFTLDEVVNLHNIDIKFYNGKSIEATYSKPKELNVEIVFLVLTTCIGLTSGLILAIDIAKTIGNKNLAKTGTLITATVTGVKYISTTTVRTMNNVSVEQYYKIKCRYKMLSGEIVEDFTKQTYAKDEAIYLRDLKKIQIKYKNKKFVIVEPIQISDVDKELKSKQTEDNDIDTLFFECETCGEIVEPTQDGLCPKCNNVISKFKDKKSIISQQKGNNDDVEN